LITLWQEGNEDAFAYFYRDHLILLTIIAYNKLVLETGRRTGAANLRQFKNCHHCRLMPGGLYTKPQ